MSSFFAGKLRHVVVVVWLCAVVGGMGVLTSYSNTAGDAATAPILLPEQFRETSDAFCLLMFAHPRCPCTRSSIRELHKLIADCESEICASVYFFAPAGAAEDWARTDLWTSAERIPNVMAVADRDGEAAKRFGASTSGQVLLYDRAGHLQFSGGITAGRGHEGENIGTTAVRNVLSGLAVTESAAPVFGCRLYAHSTDETTGGAKCMR